MWCDDVLRRRNTFYGSFAVSDETTLTSIDDPLEPCEYHDDIAALIQQIRKEPLNAYAFVVFVGPMRNAVAVVSTRTPSARHGRAMFINVVPYKNDLYLIKCVFACLLMAGVITYCAHYVFD